MLGAALLICSACAIAPPYDYSAFREYAPQSILVLPPLNASPEVQAPGSYLSTVTRPIAERGYYVFPAVVVAGFMRDNGLPSAGEMHQVSLQRIDELIGADAVLYAQVEEWGSSYFVVSSQVRVTVTFRLVHVKTGTVLWEGRASGVRDSGSGDSNIVAQLIGAAVSQIVNSLTDPSRPLAADLNWRTFHSSSRGLLPGPYAPPTE